MTDQFLTTRDIAERLGISIKTAAAWCRAGRFPGAFQVNISTGRGRAWLVPAGDLENFERPAMGRPKDADDG